MEAKQIVFTEKDRAELLTVEMQEPKHDQVMVKTAVSTVSCGTERANITGHAKVYGAGEPRVEFPRTSGYSSSGVVVKTGSDVCGIEPGDSVIVSWGSHKSYNIVSQENIVKYDRNRISDKEAALVHIATFPMAAVRKTHIQMGESVLVMGLGILGLMAVQLARVAGAVPVIAADPIPERRELAIKYGADYALDPLAEDFAEQVKNITGQGANAVIEVTGKGAGLNTALDCTARFGRVALLGCTRDSDFTVDFYRKVHATGVTLIGAHTMARPNVESNPGCFTQRDDIEAILKLCMGKRLNLEQMILETCSPEECRSVYDRLIHDPHFPTVVQFDWTAVEDETIE